MVESGPTFGGECASKKPAIQLAMVGEQDATAIRRKNPRRASDVTGPTCSFKAVDVRGDEAAHPLDNVIVGGKHMAVSPKHVEQRPAVHRTASFAEILPQYCARDVPRQGPELRSRRAAIERKSELRSIYGETAFCAEEARRT